MAMAGELTNGKYKKLTSRNQEKEFLQSHSTSNALGVKSLSISEDSSDQGRATWYTDQKTDICLTNVNSLKEENHLEVSSTSNSSPLLKQAKKLNKSDPQLSNLSTEPRVDFQSTSYTPPVSPHSSGLHSLRDKQKKTTTATAFQGRANKAASIYGDSSLQIQPKKQRPRSSIFSTSVMRRPKTTLPTTTLSLMDILETKKLKTAFLDFLESEYSSENLCFWLSCEKFKKIKGEEHRNKEGQYIYSQYISPSAPNQINIDHVTRRQITMELTTGDAVEQNVFNNAQRYVFSIMENDSFPRFLNSSFYKDASVSKKNTFETVIANILPGRNTGSTSPVRSQNKFIKNPNNNNNNSKLDVATDNDHAKHGATVFRRFSFGFRKNYATKAEKTHRSSAPDLTTEGFYNMEVKVA